MCGGSGLGAWAALALCALHFRTPPRLKQPAEATKERAHSPSPPFGVIQTNEKQQQQKQQQPAPQLCRQWRAVVVLLRSPRREHSVIDVIGEVRFFVDVVKVVFITELLVTSIVIKVLFVIVIVVV